MAPWLDTPNPSGFLQEKGVKPSYPRKKIFEYLLEHDDHPTVEEIFQALHEDIPTLSKTTVYNTLKLFADSGFVKVVSIEGNEARYDLDPYPHGHFKCEQCGVLYDFEVDMDALGGGALEAFDIREKNIYFKGICKKCKENNNTKH